MYITTKQGDTGSTRLIFGQTVAKCDPAIAAVGEVDELNAVLGLARLHTASGRLQAVIARVQDDLVALMGQLSAGPEGAAKYAQHGFKRVDAGSLEWLTAEGVGLEAEFPGGFHTWSVPGATGSHGSAWLEMARCVCRRAERAVAALQAGGTAMDPVIAAWLNRLSDVLWLAARLEEKSTAQES